MPDLMNIDPTIPVMIYIGGINLLWIVAWLVKPKARRPQSRNRWIESRSRSDSK